MRAWALCSTPPVFVLGPEDTILQKLRWYELGGRTSDRQWRDIVSVLRYSRGTLDGGYLEAVAKAASLDELLTKAFVDAE